MEPTTPQLLGYAAPALQSKRASFVLAIASYWAAQIVASFVWMTIEGSLRYGTVSSVPFSTSIAANSIGFAGSFFLVPPRRNSKRWRPYVAAALIGVATVVNGSVVVWTAQKLATTLPAFANLLWYSLGYLWDGLVFMAFCTGGILLLLFRVIIERSGRVTLA